MAESKITAAEIESYKAAVGRTVEHTEFVERHVGLRMAATFGMPAPERALPSMWHYALFLPLTATADLDVDGHPKRGDFLPPVKLPRRMFAGSSLKFTRPVAFGETVTRVSRIASVDHRHGRTGDLVLVRVAMSMSQGGATCFEEEQTIVYREATAERMPPVALKPRAPLAAGESAENWVPTTVELFRYSASTFNSHRIHYDRPYVTEVEFYPDLVVTGPLTATRLFQFAAKVSGRDVAAFTFRGEAPTFVGQEVRLVASIAGDKCAVRAERADGVTAMSATATLRA